MISHPALDRLAGAGVRLGLARMRDFLGSLDHPEGRYPVLHVGGTNGKGSACRLLGAVLQANGQRVGVHTSPHLQMVNERIRIDGTPLSDDELAAVITEVDAARLAWARQTLPSDEPYPLTYFEFTVACAFEAFARAGVDVAVLEVGMGGRLDATNVVSPRATAIVSIGLDHTAELGWDIASIAGEKAGIIKAGVPMVVGPLPAEALAIVRAVAAERSSPLHVWGHDFEAFGDGSSFRYAGASTLDGLALGLAGDHQVVNAGVALRVLEVAGLEVSPGAIRQGLAAARHPGRLEWLAPDLLADGAHNPDGATTLANFLARLPRDRRRTLVLGGGTDKDIRGVATTLAPVVDRIFTTAGSHANARNPADVAGQCEGLSVPVIAAGALAEALAAARRDGDLVVVAGSLYLVGELRDLVGAAPA
ncbi:MAG: bifunctional folylpolyglutamate synthase/dihydrofolate synthase [Myxococcales bacterium]|nr:bifunctional folylpolyglutamate synthase/dihydrofolate synthase [Myxococcales bacterium]